MDQTLPNQQSNPINASPPTPKSKSSIPLLWILAFILVGLGGFIIGKSVSVPQPVPLVLPSPIQTTASPEADASWKTYSDETLGFEFQYPENLTLTTSETINALASIHLAPPETDYSDSNYAEKYLSLSVNVYNNSNNDNETDFGTYGRHRCV